MIRKQNYFKRRGKRGTIYLNERHCGVQLWDCLDTTDERIAEIRRREIHIAVERGDYQKFKTKVESVLSKTVEDHLIGLSASTKKTYRLHVKKHLDPYFGAVTLAQLESADLVEYKRFREGQGASEETISGEIWLFVSMLKKHGVELDPVDEAYIKPKRNIDRFLTESEMLSIVGRVDLPFRAAFLIGAYSGLRKMDVVNLNWSMIDLKEGFISMRTAKKKKSVRIPIHLKLSESLALIPRGVGGTRLFRFKSPTPLNRRWEDARKEAGLEWARIHDLRHFFGCFLVNRGIRHEVIADLMGITVGMVARYARFDDKTRRDAVGVFCRQTVSKAAIDG